MNKTLQLLKNKQGGATVYIGVVVMMVAFVAVLVCVNLFKLYTINTRAQLICDAIADGSALAGQTSNGFDENKALATAQKIFENNISNSTTCSYSLSIENEYDESGSYTNCKLITVEIQMKSNYDELGSSSSLGNFTASAKSVVRVKLKNIVESWLKETLFFKSPSSINPPFEMTAPYRRHPVNVSWMIEHYLCPELNPVYDNALYIRSQKYLMSDYIALMNVLDFEKGEINDIINALIEDYYGTGFADWTIETDASTMQKKANNGLPVVILGRDSEGNSELYIVIPQRGALENGNIAVAYITKNKNSNYTAINWGELKSRCAVIYALSHL